MRKAILVGLATLSLSVVASAAQRGAVPAIPAAAAPAMRAMPAGGAPAHAPVVSGNHLASPHGPTTANRVPVHGNASLVHPATRGTAPGAKSSALPRKTTTMTTGGSPVVPPANQGKKPFIPGFLPGDTFSGQSCNFGNCYPVPGFGFDYEHFFAVHPNWGKFHPVSGVVIPGWGGGFYYPVPYYSESTPQEGQEENASAPAEQQESNVRASAPGPEETAPTTSRSYAPYAPAQPVEEYVFVKRDGTRIFAVAYSLAKDRLQYITKEGLRRTLPLDALDYDATMKSNEERGNTVNLPGMPPAAMAMVS